MKLLVYPLLIFVSIISLTACSETDINQEEFADWKQKNETYFVNLYQTAKGNTAKYKILKNWSLTTEKATKPEDHIVVEILKNGTGSGCPLYTDSVAVHYEGCLIPSSTYSGGYTFDKTWAGDYNLQTMKPAILSSSKTVDGFTTALMSMHIGDRWRVYIPYQLGYGSSTQAKANIPGYSTLVFDITLIAYGRAGTKLPIVQ